VDDWREAVVYEVYVRSYRDSDGDGVGDLAGVTASLDYLSELGVTAVWLTPIHPSPGIDLGYDVADYTAIDPALGTLGDLDELVGSAHRRGLAVIMDWVVNHTSDRHPWFVDAVSSPTSRHRDWYVFRPGRGPSEPPTNWRAMFGGSAWQRDGRSGQWYLHTFFSEQPDLNWRNPSVRQAVAAAMRFWLDRGIDGFRLDSLPLLIKDDQLRDNPEDPKWRPGRPDYWQLKPERTVDQPDMVEVLGFLRRVVDEYPDRVLIGEVGLPPARAARYFRHVQIPLNFGLITRPWTADRIARRITAHMDALPAGAWPNWVLGSHDVSRVATRLGPLLARAAAVVLLTLPGTVTLYYGDELGLTDAPVDVPSRDPLGVLDPRRSRDPQRAPMPWDATAGAGFSRGRPWLPIHPDADRLSVQAQAADPGSTLALYKELLRLRREHPEIASSRLDALRSEGGVLSYRRGRFHVSANLGAMPGPARSPVGGRPVINSQPTIDAEHGTDQLMLAPGQAIVVAAS